MKVPFTSQQNQQSVSSKSINTARNTTSQGSGNLCYEPKSVRELCPSPSPAGDKPVAKTEISTVSDHTVWQLCQSDDSLQVDDHVLNHLEDWMKEFGLPDDSTPGLKLNSQLTHSETQYQGALPEFAQPHMFEATQFIPSDFNLSHGGSYPPLNHNSNTVDLSNDLHHMNQWNVGFDYVDDLIRVAECFETNSSQFAHLILARLNQRLQSPTGKPLQRAAFYFKEALNFTANQAILEAVDGSIVVHVIDFDIGIGGHWASFMKELADKAESRKSNPPALRITALVPEEYAIESRLIRENLIQFARELNIGFEIDFVSIRTFQYLSFKAIKFVDGEKTAVLLSPAIFQRIGGGFVNDLRKISPHVVVLVDSEGLMGFGVSSLRQCVIDGLEFYSTVLESLEAWNISGGGGGGDWIRKIEMFVLLPKIFEAVEAASHPGTPWREAFAGAGLRPVGLSQFADSQAESLVGRIQVRGFHVAKQQAEMVLCWHERPLVVTSAWRC
ncbi:unnamed protein product [Ilex paraguariensis]|uniref:Scarecrow-like protein 15 n=1 Tax=Ilex paraguariensis TaxID=185542 RepID=A0ABC8S8E9_9AQUA